jgi:hypothetical protein
MGGTRRAGKSGPRAPRSITLIVRQARHRTHRNQCRAAMAAPIVGKNSIGMRFA